MSALVLDARLGKAFTTSPATELQAPEVFGLVAAEMSAVLGSCTDTEEDVRALLGPPPEAKTAQLLIRGRDTGALAQWWGGFQEPGGSHFFVWVRSDPGLVPSVADDLTRAAWGTLFAWVRAEADPDQGPVTVFSGCTTGDTAASRRMCDAGFAHDRTFWEMRGTVVGSTVPAPVAGLTLAATDDLATVHRILTDSFTGHWGYEPTPFDGWLAMEKSMPGYDPGLWVLAEIDGTPAAVMILSRRSAAEGALYVQELATLAPYRGRGIASALLGHAFDIARAEGYSQVTLHVDSDNADSAPAVYRRAGFDVRSASDMHTRVLSIRAA